MTCQAEVEPTVFDYTEGDNLPELLVQYLDSEGNPVPITGFQFLLKIAYDTPVIVTGTIVDADEGWFSFVYGDDDLKPSVWDVHITIINALSQKLTIRNISFDIAPKIA